MTASASVDDGPALAAGAVNARTAAVLDELFERRDIDYWGWHFAEHQLRSDQFGTCIGALVYLSLIPSLAELGRRDLAAAAAACSLLCLWPMALAHSARGLYAARRDYLLMIHFLFHYAVGAQLARFVRLSNKLGPASPASFLGSFVLSSTVLWQCLDAMMYRMRSHRFVLLKPIILLAVLPLERSLCRQTCKSVPGMAHYFTGAAELVGLLAGPFRLVLPPLATTNRALAGPAAAMLSCTKVQAFLLALLSWVLPIFVLRRLERKMFTQFAAGQRQLLCSSAAALASSGSLSCSGASLQYRSSSSSSSSTARPALLRRIREARQLCQLQWVQDRLQQEQGTAVGRPGCSSDSGRARRDAWAAPLLLLGLCWHAIDSLMW